MAPSSRRGSVACGCAADVAEGTHKLRPAGPPLEGATHRFDLDNALTGPILVTVRSQAASSFVIWHLSFVILVAAGGRARSFVVPVSSSSRRDGFHGPAAPGRLTAWPGRRGEPSSRIAVRRIAGIRENDGVSHKIKLMFLPDFKYKDNLNHVFETLTWTSQNQISIKNEYRTRITFGEIASLS